jgi:hypothetical protein
LPNGRYRVTAVAGDATAFDSVYDLQAEGVTFVSGTPASANLFLEGTTIVNLGDGRLSIGNGPAAVNNKIAFIDIVALGGEVEEPILNQPVLGGGNIPITWSGGTLESATSLASPTTWTPINESGTYSEPATAPCKFFRVRQ